jgi:hypothetical protein
MGCDLAASLTEEHRIVARHAHVAEADLRVAVWRVVVPVKEGWGGEVWMRDVKEGCHAV